MLHAFQKSATAWLTVALLVLGLFAASAAEAQWGGPPPPPPPQCPRGYHWEGRRGCWPNRPGIPPLCPPGMAWRHGDCHHIHGGPNVPPPPPHRYY